MKKSKLFLMNLGICILIAGCTPPAQSSSENLFEAKSEENAANSTDETTANSTDETTSKETASDSTEEGVSNEKGALNDVVSGNGKISLKYYTDNVMGKSDDAYIDELLGLIPADEEYTISELVEKLNEIVHDENNYFSEGDVTATEFAYLDCGADNVPELALRFVGPFVEPESEVTLIFKEMDGKAQLIYGFVIWSRSFTEINNNGVISGDGSNGASNHCSHMSYIDSDGVCKFGYYEEQELDFDSFADFKNHDDYDISSLNGTIGTYSLRLEQSQDVNTDFDYYTYEVFDKDSYEKMDVQDLYTDSEYKKIMDCFKDYNIVSMDEYEQAKEDKLKSIGITDDIKNAMGPSFENIDSTDADTKSKDTENEAQKKNEPAQIVDDGTVQSEIAMTEAKHQEYENLDWGAMPQVELNITTGEMYDLWDKELNSIWNNLMEEVAPEKKEELLSDQRAWINRKEAAVKAAGKEAEGGSLQPQLENGMAWSYTRKRVYYLASVLANVRGEDFVIPSEVEESYKDVDTEDKAVKVSDNEAENTENKISEDQAYNAVINYCKSNNPNFTTEPNKEGYTEYWDVSTNEEGEIVVLYRSYTAAQTRYYVNPTTGDTYVTELVPGIIDEEQMTGEKFNARDYLTD
ncbi:lysozyme inhibitor LprI family protein [Butyrivibrio sp. LC3010]|uniref:lysozyme inhibitor LprI family protein n=1 Tax=Butyrivibrio sp. LC3010 TaxID=1280680 RepID=UPI00041C44C8|nr:lysozyme inhibitor LprI family protein [Butyrivibrio sp. LC3010]